MRSTTYPLSSPRKRGPILRFLAMWHGKRDFETSVVMGPRFRGDDTESRSFVEMKTLPTEPDMSRLYTEAFLPKK